MEMIESEINRTKKGGKRWNRRFSSTSDWCFAGVLLLARHDLKSSSDYGNI